MAPQSLEPLARASTSSLTPGAPTSGSLATLARSGRSPATCTTDTTMMTPALTPLTAQILLSTMDLAVLRASCPTILVVLLESVSPTSISLKSLTNPALPLLPPSSTVSWVWASGRSQSTTPTPCSTTCGSRAWWSRTCSPSGSTGTLTRNLEESSSLEDLTLTSTQEMSLTFP